MVCGQKKRFAVRCITRDRCPNRTLIKPEGSSPAYANVCACVRFLFSSVVGWSIASSAVCCALHFRFFLGLFLIIIISVKCVCFLFFVFAVVDVVVVYPLCVIVCECTQCILAGFRTNTLIAVLVYVILLTKKKKMLSGVLWASVPVFPPLVICVRLCSYSCIHPKSNVSKTFNHTGHHTNLNCAVVEINGKCAGSTDDIDSYHGSTRFNIERDSSKTIRPHMSVYKWCTWKMSQLQLHTARNFTRNLKLFKNCAKYICCASSRK